MNWTWKSILIRFNPVLDSISNQIQIQFKSDSNPVQFSFKSSWWKILDYRKWMDWNLDTFRYEFSIQWGMNFWYIQVWSFDTMRLEIQVEILHYLMSTLIEIFLERNWLLMRMKRWGSKDEDEKTRKKGWERKDEDGRMRKKGWGCWKWFLLPLFWCKNLVLKNVESEETRIFSSWFSSFFPSLFFFLFLSIFYSLEKERVDDAEESYSFVTNSSFPRVSIHEKWDYSTQYSSLSSSLSLLLLSHSNR